MAYWVQCSFSHCLRDWYRGGQAYDVLHYSFLRNWGNYSGFLATAQHDIRPLTQIPQVVFGSLGLRHIFTLMMTSSNGNIFRVTGHLCGEFTVPGEFSTQRPVTRSFDVYFDLHPNKWLSKQSWGWWFETLSCSLWRHRNEQFLFHGSQCSNVIGCMYGIGYTHPVTGKKYREHEQSM